VPTRGFKIIEKSYKIVSGEEIYIKEETFLFCRFGSERK